MEDDLEIFPITGWAAKPVQSLNVITMKLGFIKISPELANGVDETPILSLSPTQALALADSLQAAVQQLQVVSFQHAPDPRVG